MRYLKLIFLQGFSSYAWALAGPRLDALLSVLMCPGLSSRSPLSETKSTSSSLSALSDSLNSSEGGDLNHSNDELRGLLALPSSAGSQSSSGSHSGSGTEDKSDKGKGLWEIFLTRYTSQQQYMK